MTSARAFFFEAPACAWQSGDVTAAAPMVSQSMTCEADDDDGARGAGAAVLSLLPLALRTVADPPAALVDSGDPAVVASTSISISVSFFLAERLAWA